MADAPAFVVSRYPPLVAGCRWREVGSGFSGATVWCGEFAGEPQFALKRWPGWVAANHLRQLHAWMSVARSAGCEFVPTVLPTISNDTIATTPDGCWDVTTWMPGRANFHTEPTSEKLAAVCVAVAALHRVWFRPHVRTAPCPAVIRRLELLDTWATRRSTFDFNSYPESARTILTRSIAVVAERVVSCRASLEQWRTVPVPVFPCHCDLWQENVLLTDDRVTGIIDYGAMKIDSPAVDLARLLGDLVGPYSVRFIEGVDRYHAANPPVAVPPELVQLLAVTGTVCALANWHLRLANRVPSNLDSVMRRIETILSTLTGE